MARRKQATPLRREASSEYFSHTSNGEPLTPTRALSRNPSSFSNEKELSPPNGKTSSPRKPDLYTNGSAPGRGLKSPTAAPKKKAGLTELVICVGGIYASFLTWALLQERITTTTYGPPEAPERWTYSLVLNTVQSLLASLTGYIYLKFTSPSARIIPTRAIFPPLVLIAITSSLASPFGYASLAHIDYLTFILAKSCKLLPVMALHLTVFRTRYPLYKYAVVAAVTTGVAIFTLHTTHKKGRSEKNSSLWGLLLLSTNLLLDGLTNSTQDHIFSNYQPYSGPQMMCAQNLLTTLLTIIYLLLAPIFGPVLGIADAESELTAAWTFLQRHPRVIRDVIGFGACGALGQIFIFYTLSSFSSLLLVTVTVTRKMLTMILSVLWFGHRLSGMQWAGVGLVFGAVGAEGVGQRMEKAAKAKEAAKKKAAQVPKKEL